MSIFCTFRVLYFIEQAHTYQAHTYQAHTYQAHTCQASSLFAIKISKVASLCRAFVHSQLLCPQQKLFRISISKIERLSNRKLQFKQPNRLQNNFRTRKQFERELAVRRYSILMGSCPFCKSKTVSDENPFSAIFYRCQWRLIRTRT